MRQFFSHEGTYYQVIGKDEAAVDVKDMVTGEYSWFTVEEIAEMQGLTVGAQADTKERAEMSDEIRIGDTINGQYKVINFGAELGSIIGRDVDTEETVILHLSEVTRHDWTPPAGYEKYLAPVVEQPEEPAQVSTQEEQRKVWLAGLQGGDKVLICHESGSIVGYGFVRGYRSSAKSVYVWECSEYPCGERFSRLTGRVRGGDMYIHPYSDERYEALRSYRAHPETWLTVEAPSVLDAPVQEPAQVAYPLTSETMYGKMPSGGTAFCKTCGIHFGYETASPPVLCGRCAPEGSARKVEALAENPKHLDKPGRRETPRRTDGFCSTFAMAVHGGWWGRKVYSGRNKSSANVSRIENDILVYDTAGDARLSPSALVRWFPVALENTTYSDAIARHSTWMGQEGLRVTPGFVFGHRLSSKYDGRRYFDKEWAPNELWGNKAQVNRYHSCKTY